MAATVDKDTCIGCGACSATCPDVFSMKDGKAEANGKDEECAKKAQAGCPVGAISGA